MNDAIQVENLTKIYGRPGAGVLAVDHIQFNVKQGEIFRLPRARMGLVRPPPNVC